MALPMNTKADQTTKTIYTNHQIPNHQPSALCLLLSFYSLYKRKQDFCGMIMQGFPLLPFRGMCMSETQESETQESAKESATQESEVITRLSAIESQLQQFGQILTTLSDRLQQSEQSLMLVTDVQRYEKLQKLLAAGDFVEADWETIRVIQAVTGEPNLEDITPDDMRQFPCSALRVVDNLWKIHSGGRFGFGVQIRIYQEVGGTLESTISQDRQLVEKFGEQVGWRVNEKWLKCDDLDYTLNAPVGCHPSRWWNSPFGSKMTNFFFNRLITCGI
jgi:molybdopterin converting factor small subunit